MLRFNTSLISRRAELVWSALALVAISSVAYGSVIPESHIPAKVKQYTDHGKAEGSLILPVTVALSLNNEDELDQRLAEMYRPGSPNYHQFMSQEEFRQRYAPTPLQIEDAKNFLEEHGIETTGVSANGHFIQAIGNVSVLSETFQTEVHTYQDAQNNAYISPAIEPTFPANLTIRAIHGLDNLAEIRSHSRHRPIGDLQFAQGTGPNKGLTPNDIRSAYQVPALVGNGQVMALVELDGYSESDIQAYEQQFGLPNVAIQNIMLDGATGVPGAGADEVTLDIELMAAIAPAAGILVYEAKNAPQSLLNLYSRIASDNTASVISTSWGEPEIKVGKAFLTSESNVFRQMAAQGQSFYAAAGDNGAYDNGKALTVDDPASQPYVVGVGGTRLTMTGPGGSYVSESTWNGGSIAGGGGGGGISTVWPQPAWQSGLSTTTNRISANTRNVPDVALNADPETGYAIFFNGQWGVDGGTSAAAPLWAAFTALVNQERASLGKSRVGFVSPAFYAIGKTSHYASDFHDIADGSNNLGYSAVPGYDDATGWGTLQGVGMLQDLSSN